MLVDVSDIISGNNKITAIENNGIKRITKEVSLEFTSVVTGMGEFPVIEKTPFTLCFTNVEDKQLKIEGKADVTIAIPCDRCLSEVANRFILQIEKVINLDEINLEKLTDEDIGEMEHTNYMIGKNLDVDKLIFGEILVSWPMKVLCREECKGICKNCGSNLNLKTCRCRKAEPDPRMAAIQDIFNQYKEV